MSHSEGRFGTPGWTRTTKGLVRSEPAISNGEGVAGTLSQIRTDTDRGLKPMPLPNWATRALRLVPVTGFEPAYPEAAASKAAVYSCSTTLA